MIDGHQAVHGAPHDLPYDHSKPRWQEQGFRPAVLTGDRIHSMKTDGLRRKERVRLIVLVKLGVENQFQQMAELCLLYAVVSPLGHRRGVPVWRIVVKAMNDHQIVSWYDHKVMAAGTAR